MLPPIIIFTNTYPYGTGEAFFATELPFLLMFKRPITLVPLYGSGRARTIPRFPHTSVTVAPPLLPFDPKDRVRLLFRGLFSFAPLFFAVSEFFGRQVWRSRTRIWQFGVSFLLIRAILGRNRRFFNQAPIGTGEATLYFYWGDKTALILPFLRKRGKSVVRFHGSDLYEEVKGFLPFRDRLFPAIDLACPISQHGADYLQQRYGALAPPVAVSRLGSVDCGLGLVPEEGGVFHLVSCANIIPLKRLHLIAKAVALLRGRIQDTGRVVKWTHIGDGPLQSQIEGYADFCGPMPHDKVMAFYKETPVDLFVSASSSEGIPVSMMEAMSFGIPVLGTRVGGVAELVSNGWGRLLPPHPTAEEIVQELLWFIRLPLDQRLAMRQKARDVWETGWSAEVNFTRFCTLL
jgi:glycosyltransferase involved in cell wall biosynthesis